MLNDLSPFLFRIILYLKDHFVSKGCTTHNVENGRLVDSFDKTNMGEECGDVGDGAAAITGWLSIADSRQGKITDPKHAIEVGHEMHWTATQVGQVGIYRSKPV